MGEIEKLKWGREGGEGRRGGGGGELYMRGEMEKLDWGRRGGVGSRGRDLSRIW